MPDINSPAGNDNRNYDYSRVPVEERKEYTVIAGLVPRGATVLDLGCGNGSLLALLRDTRGAIGVGIELAESGVAAARAKGLDARVGRIDEPLPFADNAFDVAVCNVTLQMVLYPETLLSEMRRVARRQIVSFPNFGFYRNRLDLLLHGRMPRPMLFGYSWYGTGHIHQLSMADFEQLVAELGGLRIVNRVLELSGNPLKKFLMRQYPNLFQVLPVYELEKL